MDDPGSLMEIDAWREMAGGLGAALLGRISDFLPQVIGALALLAAGWLVARGVEVATARTLRTLGVDRAAARLQIASLLERAEIGLTTSRLVARAVFWILLLTVFLSAVEVLGLTAVTSTIDRFVAFVPNLIAAGLITMLGLLAGRALGGIVRSTATVVDLRGAARLGLFVQWGVVGLSATIALEQLGIATDILVAPVTAVVGALTLSAGLAFALGARPIVTHILAGHFLKRSLPREGFIMVEGERGLIERIGPTETRLRGESKHWTVPNGRLLEDVVTWG